MNDLLIVAGGGANRLVSTTSRSRENGGAGGRAGGSVSSDGETLDLGYSGTTGDDQELSTTRITIESTPTSASRTRVTRKDTGGGDAISAGFIIG